MYDFKHLNDFRQLSGQLLHYVRLDGSFIKRQTSGTSSDSERQRVTTSDNEWYND